MYTTPADYDTIPTLPHGHILRDEYRIERKLGQGSFGITYLATELITDYPVVIKENYPRDYVDRDLHTHEIIVRRGYKDAYDWAMESFEKEARTLRRLPAHANLVRVTSTFRALNTAYIVMDCIDGQNLHELYRDGKTMEPELLESILRKMLSTLSSLHEQGIIHRDIKPGNIMLTGANEPVLIDFGAARPTQGTHTATKIGTTGYAPPEQMEFDDEENENAEKKSPQPQWDLYALGSTCHQLITGRLPIAGSRKLTERPELLNKYPDNLLKSIDKARDISPDKRWQSAQDWLRALPTSQTTAQPKKHRTWLRKTLLTLGALTLTACTTFGYTIGLHWAAANDHELALRFFLALPGIDCNKTFEGQTPLHFAVFYANDDLVKILIDNGADCNKRNADNETPLHLATFIGHFLAPFQRAICTELLLHYGADPNAKNNRGQTPLHNACMQELYPCVELLIEKGAEVDPVNNTGITPLMYASKNYKPNSLLLLLNKGADATKRDDGGKTAQDYARRGRVLHGNSQCEDILWNIIKATEKNAEEATPEEPTPTPEEPTPTPTPEEEYSLEAELTGYYTIRHGDTLAKVAKKHNITVDELMRLNNLSSHNSFTLKVGMRLKIAK